MDLTVSSEIRQGVALVTVTGDVDVASAPRLAEHLDRTISAGRTYIVVDLEGVTFMDSTGLGVLVARLKLLRVLGGSMRAVCTVPRILRLFDITGLDNVLPIDATLAESIATVEAALPPRPAGVGE